MSFQIRPGQLIRIVGCELTGSTVVADKLGKFHLDSIEGRLSFFEDGRYPHGAEKYTCGVAVAVAQEGRTGMSQAMRELTLLRKVLRQEVDALRLEVRGKPPGQAESVAGADGGG